jgi:hypothetical protein
MQRKRQGAEAMVIEEGNVSEVSPRPDNVRVNGWWISSVS